MKHLSQESIRNFCDKKARHYLASGDLKKAVEYARAAGWDDPLSIYLKEQGV